MAYTVYTHLTGRAPEVVGEYDSMTEARKHLMEERDLMIANDMKVYSDIAARNKITWIGGVMYIEYHVQGEPGAAEVSAKLMAFTGIDKESI